MHPAFTNNVLTLLFSTKTVCAIGFKYSKGLRYDAKNTDTCFTNTYIFLKICIVLRVSAQCAACVRAVCVSPLSKLYKSRISCHSPLGEVSVLPVTSGLEEWSDSVGQVGWNSLFI